MEGGQPVNGLDAALPWLAPSCASLAALARPSMSFWASIRHDPAAILLLLRHADDPSPPRDETVLLFALCRLTEPPVGLFDWNDSAHRTRLESSWLLARLTSALAQRTGRADQVRAWCVGLLTPLAPVPTLRRIGRAWNLPSWLTETFSRVELPSGTLGGDGSLCALLRLSIFLARKRGVDLGLIGRGEALDADAALLGLRCDDLVADDLLTDEFHVPAWRSPYDLPLLRELLTVAADNLRLRGGKTYERLEAETDQLQAVLRDQVRCEAERLRQAKLTALGEFAAGAGHEINNPLAVISGQAQYVLSHAADWLTADDEGHTIKALQTIIGQTKRIHGMLRDLMQFARPAPAHPSRFDLPTLMGEVVSSVAELAAVREVRVEVDAPHRLTVWADPGQVSTALSCLLKNAVEAVPAGGWTRLSLQADHTSIEVAVEDSGPGPSPEQRPHLFDPFYSGRNAGRGKGLGLPVAWRLARQQGGDVRLEPPRPGRPTRFVLSLPTDEGPENRRAA